MDNNTSLDTLCGALAYEMGIDAPKEAAPKGVYTMKYVNQLEK